MLIQEQSIKSLDLSELDFDNEKKELEDDIAEEDTPRVKEDIGEFEDKNILAKKINLVQNAQKLSSPRVEEEKDFDKFLDIMEVF